MADADKVDPADEPDTSATPAEPEDVVDDDTVDEGSSERELVTAGSASRSGAKDTSEAGSGTGRGRSKKDKATPKQKQVAEQDRRTGPVTFLRESVSELQKVVYPTGQQLVNYFVVVLIFVLFIIAIVTALDFAFGKAILAVFS